MNHLEAKVLVDSLVPESAQLSALVRVVGSLESNYGQASYLTPDGPIRKTNNWGAITGTYNGAYFLGVDSKWSKEKGAVEGYTTKFRLYPTPSDGAADLAALLSSRYSKAVAAVPDWPEVAHELYGYYLGIRSTREANERDWAARATSVAKSIAKATGETWLAPNVGQTAELVGAGGLAIAGALGALFWLARRRKRT
jgi:basic membrane lipoprotein Med (substrate-binding protein (PBP1-ABC) superfamily)